MDKTSKTENSNDNTNLNALNQNENLSKEILIDNMHLNNYLDTDEKELTIFLYTIFQFYLEQGIKLMNRKEIRSKFKAFQIIEYLKQNSYMNYIKSNMVIYTIVNGILDYYLASCNQLINQQIIDDNLPDDFLNSEKHFNSSLNHFNNLPYSVKIRFINYYQEIFNNLGIIYFNREETSKSLQYFGKAEQIYNSFSSCQGPKLIPIFEEFIKNQNNNKNSEKNELRSQSISDQKNIFNFFIDGGIDCATLDKNYTQTLFYFAQVFAKLNFKKKGIYYCCQTLKRQIDSNTYNLKDVIINCLNLSEFFLENQNFAQAEYLLLAGFSLLPEDKNKKKKLRAQLQIQLGKSYLERMKFSQYQVKEQLWFSDNSELNETVNKRVCVFSSLNVAWPKITDVRNKEEAKCIFRLSNTQLTRALEYFVLDGYVTEHITVSKYVSSLYKTLIFFEDDSQRIFLMLDRRIKMLEIIINTISKMHFIVQWQELTLELAEIYAEYFEKKFELTRENKDEYGLNVSICKQGYKAIEYYKSLLEYIDSEVKKQTEEEKSMDDFITFITIQLTVARLYSKINPKNNVGVFKENLVKALRCYIDTKNRLSSSKFTKGCNTLEEQLAICEEMVSLLPVKIQQIN